MDENSLGETFGGGGRGCLEIGRWWGEGESRLGDLGEGDEGWGEIGVLAQRSFGVRA